uniref:RGS domain-containing protein n=1 Tax=Globodera pallida TaxID=36090 RepID=A0A183C013_GLOPA
MRPLISASFEELRRQGSEIDGGLVACFRRMDIRKRSKFFFEVEREARKKWQEGEGEASFILYCRARRVQDLVLEAMDEFFEQSLEGCWFFETSERMASDFNQVSECLETQFEVRELERELSSKEDAFLPKMREICSRANLRMMAQDEPSGGKQKRAEDVGKSAIEDNCF